MKMSPSRYLRDAALLLAFSVATGHAGAAQPETLAELFEGRYQQLVRQVEAGALPPETKAEAKAIWFALRKDIIALDAEVETLKLDVMSQQGAREEAALERLAEKIREREQRLTRAIQDLDELASEAVSSVPAAAASMDVRKSGEAKKENSEKTTIRAFDIEIELAPEDLTKGDME